MYESNIIQHRLGEPTQEPGVRFARAARTVGVFRGFEEFAVLELMPASFKYRLDAMVPAQTDEAEPAFPDRRGSAR
jgi:hypothetical protein